MVNYDASSDTAPPPNNSHDLLSDGFDEDIPQAPLSQETEDEYVVEDGQIVLLGAEEEEDEPLFTPPLYLQRYCYVEDAISKRKEEMNLKSLVDFGCAEMSFLVRARNGKQFERIIGVDFDEFLVGSNVRRIQPGVFEMHRHVPLKMEAYAGDATLPDSRLKNVDVVTAIELIEHMETKDHPALVINIFDVIQPKLIIFTTPNVEYNVLFPNGGTDKRRHWDHRFEWTREEFQAWANKVVERYPYTVEFDGVGRGPQGTEFTHGFCSQIAVFVRRSDVPLARRRITAAPYKLMSSVDYPWSPPKTPFEELVAMFESECYEYTKELQAAAEADGRYYEEYFTFTLEDLYKNRWRLIDLLNGDLTNLPAAALKIDSEWLKFDSDTQMVTYRLLLQEDEFDKSPDLDTETAGEYPAWDSQEEQQLYELTDAAQIGDQGSWGNEEDQEEYNAVSSDGYVQPSDWTGEEIGGIPDYNDLT